MFYFVCFLNPCVDFIFIPQKSCRRVERKHKDEVTADKEPLSLAIPFCAVTASGSL